MAMKVKYNIYIIGLFCFISAFCNIYCNSKSDVFRQLEGVERLFLENQDSVAAIELDKIIAPADSTADLALYNYLQAKLSARKNQCLPSNILDYSINHFENTNDSIRLSYAYNYKSIFLLNENNKKEARKLNYASERIASNLNDDILLFNIYSNGYLIAAYHYDTDECLSYANKAYMTGRRLDDIRRMAYPAVFLTMCYNEKKIPDSTKKYMAVCLNFINDYDDYTRSMVYNVFGDVLSQTDDTMSEHYYKESVSINNNEDAYNGLTQLYLKQGKIQQADTCYQKALRPKAYETNINLMKIYANKLQSIGDMVKAVEILNKISDTKDSLYEETKDGLNNRLNILTDDLKQTKDKTESLSSKSLIYRILLLIFVLNTAILSILVYRHKKTKSETAEDVTQYEQPETESDENMGTSNDNKDIAYGKQLYKKMIEGCENISQLNKKQRMSIVKYYESIDSEYINQLKITYEYEKLSINYIIILILQHIGKDKNFIIDIMGITDQATRSLKSRMEKYHL